MEVDVEASEVAPSVVDEVSVEPELVPSPTLVELDASVVDEDELDASVVELDDEVVVAPSSRSMMALANATN